MIDETLPNSRMYRSELVAEPGGGWSVKIDGLCVAITDEDLDNGQARQWAQQQLGETLRWLPSATDDAAVLALEQGRRLTWVSTPDRDDPVDAATDDATDRRLEAVSRRLGLTGDTHDQLVRMLRDRPGPGQLELPVLRAGARDVLER